MKLITTFILFFIIGITNVHYASAQTNEINSNSSDWINILFTGVTTAVISAGVNLIITIKKIQDTIKVESLNLKILLKLNH